MLVLDQEDDATVSGLRLLRLLGGGRAHAPQRHWRTVLLGLRTG